MTETEEHAYIKGRKAAFLSLLRECLKELGQEGNDHVWAVERAETIAVLKDICGEHGDLDWNEDLFIPDILRKHLQDHLGTG